ncbi:NAD(P)-binding protein [Amylostereum chailletii]|nr:NAD(P)-binding protein [Amylostereum chailletii]
MALARVALVTGAARGIGRGIALRLASDGLDVAVNDIPPNRAALTSLVSEIEGMGRRGSVVTADVSDEIQVKGMVAQAVETLGGLDVMVANAGIYSFSTILNITTEDLHRIFSVNILGVLFCYKHAAKQMVEQGRGGRIIGAASVAGIEGLPDVLSYSMSKFAVRGLTHGSATELAKYGITVNAYAPGAIDTDMLASAQIETESEDRDSYVTGIPVGRLGQPSDIAQLVSFFASERSSFVTGVSLAPLPSTERHFRADTAA